MKNIFVYGSLMHDEVLRRLLSGSHAGAPARLHHYRRSRLHGERYPGIRPARGHHVDGMLLCRLGSRDVRVLDRFEGGLYRRSPVRVVSIDGARHAAEAYVIRGRYRRRLSAADWCSERFRDRHLSRFLHDYAHW